MSGKSKRRMEYRESGRLLLKEAGIHHFKRGKEEHAGTAGECVALAVTGVGVLKIESMLRISNDSFQKC